MDATHRQLLIDRYRQSLDEFDAAVVGLAQDELDRRAAPGEWAVGTIIHHVADTDVIAGGRLRLLLARNGAPIAAYGEEELADVSDAGSRSSESSLALIRSLHGATLELLLGAKVKPLLNTGVHEQIGEYSVALWVERRSQHLQEHSQQIREARAK
ncbi:MAG: DinB family protein [Candidatus Dormibacteraeota bacterium]|uniref:DinB family protein n=1 Tax=Candidatus Amunia macphersoniae TaxID=3127014 RepID=A0A934N8W1_9BACT|nr:DinB family protein [Candidatus Dormibacteraeota bacterium]